MAKDNWEKLEIVAGLLGGVLVPVAIFFAGSAISSADRDNAKLHAEAERSRAELNAQADRLTEMIEHLASDNKKQQMIALEVAAHLAEKKQFPEALLPTFTRLAKDSPDAATAQAATQVVSKAVEQSTSEAAKTAKEAFATVTPRVYFHIADKAQHARASEVEKALEKDMQDVKLRVPGIELKAGPLKTELRYFKEEERGEAQTIVNALAKLGVQAELKDLSKRYKDPGAIRARHYELWMGRDSS